MESTQCRGDNKDTELANFIATQRELFRKQYGHVTLDFICDCQWDIDDHKRQFLVQATKFFPETAENPIRASRLFYDLIASCCKKSNENEYICDVDNDDDDNVYYD